MASNSVPPHRSRWLVLLLAALGARTAIAAPQFGLLGGIRYEDSDDQLPTVAGTLILGEGTWRVRPELDLSLTYDPLFNGSETETGLGAVAHWDVKKTRIHLGAGLSSIHPDFGANSGSSTGLHVHAGATWPVKSRRMGFDVRYLRADDLDVSGGSFPVGYYQIAFSFLW